MYEITEQDRRNFIDRMNSKWSRKYNGYRDWLAEEEDNDDGLDPATDLFDDNYDYPYKP